MIDRFCGVPAKKTHDSAPSLVLRNLQPQAFGIGPGRQAGADYFVRAVIDHAR